MSQNTQLSNFDDAWRVLLEAFDCVYQIQTLKPSAYMQLLTLVYNYCTRNHLLSKSTTSSTVHQANIGGEELYANIKNYLTNHLETIFQNGIDLQGDNILRFYSDHWGRYKFPSKVLDAICDYLNRYYIPRSIQSNNKEDVDYIFNTAMKTWERVFFKTLNKQVTETCLNMIQAERNGVVTNTNLISEVIQSYVTLDSCQTTSQSTIYKQFFEDSFIEHTEQFYLIESANFLSRNSVTEYLRKVAQRIDEEVHRVQSYLHPSTSTRLMKKLEDVLIRDNLTVIYEESKLLLQDDRNQDLSLLFKLISRVPSAIDPLRNIFENHIHQVGLDSIERINKNAATEPEIYIETILQTYKKFLQVVKNVFNSQQQFLTARDNACVKFINHNAVTQSTGKTNISAELLARYCDILLRKGNRGVEENVLEEKFNDIMAIFNYMNDKDVFEKFYRNRLAKRLVGELSASDDQEGSMITKLKQVCGFEYTLKLQRMFQDISVSKDLTNEYRVNREQRRLGDTGFSVMVLTLNSWPFSVSPNLVLPIEIKSTLDDFTMFYSNKHNGRKLMWLHQHWKAELQTLYTKPKYILQVSTYQMNILLLFNQKTVWIVEQIQDQTQIPKEIFLQVLDSLLKAKLLICEEMDPSDENGIQMNYAIKLADNFKSNKIKINLNVPLKSVEQKETDTVRRTIDDDRKFVIQAAIVRIMKARQTLKHALIMQEVIQQLNSRFQPLVSQIKKCVEMLIETGYLRRNDNDRDTLIYVA